MMIGPNVYGKGGISSVIKGYFDSGITQRLNIEHYQSHQSGGKLFKLLFYFLSLPKIVLKMHKYDILHIHTASQWSFRRKFFIALIGKIMGKKMVIHLHGGKFDTYYKNTYKFEKAMIRFFYKIADRVIILSREWKEKVKLFCDSEKLIVIPNCIPIGSLNQEKKNKKPRNIIFLGELGLKKGVFDLLDAINLMELNENEVQFFLYGNGELEKVKDKIQKLKLETIVHAPGWIFGKNKATALDQAYMFILPSYHEGLPVSLLEALANGIPVIATPVGGIPTAVKNGFNGFLVPVNSPGELSDSIQKLLIDNNLWSTFSINAFNTAKKYFSMESLERKMSDLYIELSKP